jgi:hypothetical protein
VEGLPGEGQGAAHRVTLDIKVRDRRDHVPANIEHELGSRKEASRKDHTCMPGVQGDSDGLALIEQEPEHIALRVRRRHR